MKKMQFHDILVDFVGNYLLSSVSPNVRWQVVSSKTVKKNAVTFSDRLISYHSIKLPSVAHRTVVRLFGRNKLITKISFR